MARAKHKKLMLTGNEEDFKTFMEQFEARMYMLKLDRVLRDKITTPVIKPEEHRRGEMQRRLETIRGIKCGASWCCVWTGGQSHSSDQTNQLVLQR